MISSKTKAAAAALLFAIFSLGGMIAIPGLSLVPITTVYAQTSLAEDIVGSVLGDDEEEEAADNTQTVEQPVTQDTNQDVDQSEENEQSNTNTQTQVGAIGQDIEQGIQDGDDEAESESQSGDAKADKKGSTASSSSSSGDAASINNLDAANGASLQQVQVQNVDQNNFGEFGDDIADLAAVNVGLPIAVPINVQLEEEEVIEEPDDEVPPPSEEEDAFFCIIGVGPGTLCFESLAECEEAPVIGGPDCQRFETLPEGAALCEIVDGRPVCRV